MRHSIGVAGRAKQAISGALFAGAAGLSLAPALAAAQDTPPERRDDATSVERLTVVPNRIEPDSTKFVAPLQDTPLTVTVVPAGVIEAQNLLTLRDVLSTVPGITFGAGEGGGGYGDSINLRGYAASNAISTDGLRDTAQYTRSDPFNLEQIEVTNGATSVYGGTGNVGGSINLVSKSPTSREFTDLSLGVGTDSYGRITVDTNRPLSDNIALRLNLMAHANDVPRREVERFERWGFAPSLTLGLMGMTQVTFSYFHQSDDNVPQYGVPYASNSFLVGPLPGVNPEDYFGYHNIDTQEIDADAFTVRIDHEFNADLRLRNLTRWQQVDQLSIVNAPQGTYCLASGFNPANGATCTALNTFQPSGNPRGLYRDTTNEQLINQTDLIWRFDTGMARHSVNIGVTLSEEDFHMDNGNVLRNPLGATPNPTLPLMDLDDPDTLWTGAVNPIQLGATDGTLASRAIYAFDAIELNDHWEINGGIRFERAEGTTTAGTFAVPYPAPPAPPVVTQGPVFRNAADLFSYRLGVVFKPNPDTSYYAAFGNAESPSQESVRQGCNATTCNTNPEEAENIEIGGKWALNDGRLSLTAAAFRNERTNYRVASNDPAEPDQVLDGHARVDGLALGASGVVREGWSVFANYTYLDSEVLRGISLRCTNNPGIPDCAGVVDNAKGQRLTNTPTHAASLWTTYEATDSLTLGYGATYSGEYLLNNTNGVGAEHPSYVVHRVMVSYAIGDRHELRLNVNNVTDEIYYQRIRSSGSGFGWATPGDGMNAILTLNSRF